eukprot:COSAG01_NODE_95_length_26957_cov_48.328617_23_plen_111_part_00
MYLSDTGRAHSRLIELHVLGTVEQRSIHSRGRTVMQPQSRPTSKPWPGPALQQHVHRGLLLWGRRYTASTAVRSSNLSSHLRVPSVLLASVSGMPPPHLTRRRQLLLVQL